jgi:antirestriction protein
VYQQSRSASSSTAAPSRHGSHTTSRVTPATCWAFEDAYQGEWDSLRDYAEDFAESTGMNQLAESVGSPYITVDIDALERDLDIELYTVGTGHHTIYVFDPNV